MPSGEWLLGIDLGASSLKCTALESATGKTQTQRQAISSSYPQPGWVEQNPYEWTEKLAVMLANYSKNPPLAIAVSAGAHIPVLLDKNKKPLRSAILWSDQRSAVQAAILRKKHGNYIHSHTFNTPSATWSLPMLMWLKEHEPQILSATKWIVFAKDYLRMMLCPQMATDAADAVGAMLADQRQMCWDTVLCQLAGIDIDKLPPICSPNYQIGVTSGDILPAGIAVVTGSIDTSVELLSAGALNTNTHVLKLASAGVYSWIANRGYRSQVSCYPHVYPGGSYFATGTNSCMSSLHWFGKTFIGKSDLSSLDALASKSTDDCPLFHPYLVGERAPLWNANVRSAFSGIGITHNKANFCLAVYRGVCYSLRHAIEQTGNQPSVLRVIGGGSASPILLRELASILNCQLQVQENNDASVGSALLAGIAINVYADWQDAVDNIAANSRFIEPNSKAIPMYNTAYHKFLKMIDSLD